MGGGRPVPSGPAGGRVRWQQRRRRRQPGHRRNEPSPGGQPQPHLRAGEHGRLGAGLQPEGRPGQFQAVSQREGGGAAGALPRRLAGAGQVPEQPGRHLLLHLQGRGDEAAGDGAPVQRPPAGPLQQPAVHGGLRGGQPDGGPGAPLPPPGLGLPDGASAAPGPALAAALPGEPAHQPRGRAHRRTLHGLLQRLAGRLPPLDHPPGRHRGLLHAAHAQGLPGGHERGVHRAGRGHAGRGPALHRARVRHLAEALRRARPAGPALGAGGLAPLPRSRAGQPGPLSPTVELSGGSRSRNAAVPPPAELVGSHGPGAAHVGCRRRRQAPAGWVGG